MSFVLDTNILIEIENNNQDLIEKINSIKNAPNAELCLTIFSFCEFYIGAIKKSEKNKEKILERLGQYVLLNTTQRTGILFCELRYKLQKNGTLLPHFDIFIATLCIENDYTLITSDAHFKDIPGLKRIFISM